MKLSHYLAVFMLVLLAMIVPSFMRTRIIAQSARNNNEYAQFLITATQSAIDTAAADNRNGTYVFDTSQKRENTVDAFYKTLIQCFGYEYSTYEPLVKNYVPCVILVDTDGYYVSYGEEYTDSNGVVSVHDIISPISKWSRSYSPGSSANLGYEFYVEYHLDDTVKITYLKNDHVTIYEGYYAEVYENMKKDDVPLNSMTTADSIEARTLEDLLSSYSVFYNEKKEVIISSIQQKLEYYINTKNETNNQNGKYQYQFTLPKVTEQDWARMVDGPTILSFLQGPQTEYGTYEYNLYSLAGSEIEYDYAYYIKDVDGASYYHLPSCSHLTDSDITERKYSMEKAASLGAYPCPDCLMH